MRVLGIEGKIEKEMDNYLEGHTYNVNETENQKIMRQKRRET